MAGEQEYLLKKIDSIEQRFESHVTKIEQRLDQIVNLMQTVASLQEKESRNSENIKDLKNDLKETVDKFDRTVNRIHERLDRYDQDNNREQDQVAQQINIKFNTLSDKISAVDSKVDKWMNRGIGIWIGVSALVMVLQTIGALFISSMRDEYQLAKTQVQEVVGAAPAARPLSRLLPRPPGHPDGGLH
jgi:uncharacterized phage infection (PIP) family protein YhgE